MNETENNVMGIDEMLASLETMADDMESGSLSLEESFAVYEKAVGMLRELEHRIGDAEERIMKLTEEGNLVPLDEGPGPMPE